MPVLSLACHLPHNTPNIPSRYNNEQTTKQTKAINNSYIYISHVNVTQTVPDISPLMPMHQDPLLVSLIWYHLCDCSYLGTQGMTILNRFPATTWPRRHVQWELCGTNFCKNIANLQTFIVYKSLILKLKVFYLRDNDWAAWVLFV